MTCGVVYVAVGATYRQEAAVSARSLREHMPDILVTLVSDEAPDPEAADVFDTTMVIDPVAGNRLDKIENLHRVPYDRVLFLDSDTYVCASLAEAFELLDRFDIAMAHALRRVHEHYPPLPGVPGSFPEYNSGVIAFRNTPQVRETFAAWADLYREGLHSEWYRRHRETRPFTLQDQHHLRKALYEADVRIATLPYEYNCRLMPGLVSGSVRVVHGRHTALPEVAAKLNASTNRRLIVPSRRSLYQVGAREETLVPLFSAVDRLRRLTRWFGREG